MYMYMCIYIYMCVHVYVYIYTYIHTCIHTYIHPSIHPYIHTYIHGRKQITISLDNSDSPLNPIQMAGMACVPKFWYITQLHHRSSKMEVFPGRSWKPGHWAANRCSQWHCGKDKPAPGYTPPAMSIIWCLLHQKSSVLGMVSFVRHCLCWGHSEVGVI